MNANKIFPLSVVITLRQAFINSNWIFAASPLLVSLLQPALHNTYIFAVAKHYFPWVTPRRKFVHSTLINSEQSPNSLAMPEPAVGLHRFFKYLLLELRCVLIGFCGLVFNQHCLFGEMPPSSQAPYLQMNVWNLGLLLGYSLKCIGCDLRSPLGCSKQPADTGPWAFNNPKLVVVFGKA